MLALAFDTASKNCVIIKELLNKNQIINILDMNR